MHRAIGNARNITQVTVVRPGAGERELVRDPIERMHLGATEPETLPFGGVRFLISKPLAGSTERRLWIEGIVELVHCGWAPQLEQNATNEGMPSINA